MLQKIRIYLALEFDQESPKSRMERVKQGIVMGLIGSLTYTISASLVNIISYPDLHLGVNWINLVTTWIVVCLALILAGFIVGWPTEEVKAIVGGGIALTVVLLAANSIAYLLLNPVTRGSYFQVLVTSLPMVGVSVLAALALRQGMNKLDRARKEENKSTQRKLFNKIIGLVVLLGIIGGLFSRFDGTAVTMLQSLNDRLQSTDLTSSSKVRFPENVLADVQSHFGEGYRLFVRSASATVGALDVTIHFDSGYIVTCQIPTATGTFIFMDSCAVGTKLN
jgi:hypothetical protein